MINRVCIWVKVGARRCGSILQRGGGGVKVENGIIESQWM